MEDQSEITKAASIPEEPEGPEETLIGKIGSSAPKDADESRGNDYIREANEKIGQNGCPEKAGIAGKAIPMRKEVCGQQSARGKP